MSRTDDLELAIARATGKRHESLRDDLVHLRQDAGLTRAAVARAARVDAAYIGRIEDRTERPSIETYQRLATALGADLHTRIYPNTGPAIHDRHQAAILEVMLRVAHPRWQRFVEVGVRRPVRGSIDVALHEPADRVIVAAEIESALRRLEQQIRWSMDKAAALVSWDGWSHLGEEPEISRLLVIRRTRVTRRIVDEFQRQLRAAYPAHPDDALAALTGTAPWPGPALVWALVDGRRTRLLSGR
jgi:transcriptional regulator with XRE-family HTH domain